MSYRHYSMKEPVKEELNVRLLSISLSKDEQNQSGIFHTHHFTELFFVANGRGSFLFRDETRSIEAGSLVIIPPYTEHTEELIAGSSLTYYALAIEGISFVPEDGDKGVQIFCNFTGKDLIFELFSQMLYEVQHMRPGFSHICQNLLEILILRIARSQHLVTVAAPAARMTKECAYIKEYLDTNYAEPITLDTLTALTHMNKYYMAHSFSKYTGLSPIKYLNLRRLEAARALLADTDRPVSDIASAVGFSSQSYFTQLFSRKYGISPIKYRRRSSDGAGTSGS